VIKQRAVNHYASNKNRNILNQHKARKSNKLVEAFYKDATFQVQVQAVDPNIQVTPTLTAYRTKEMTESISKVKEELSNPEKDILIEFNQIEAPTEQRAPVTEDQLSKEESEGGYLFETEFESSEPETEIATELPEQLAIDTVPATEDPYLFQTEFDEVTPRVGSDNEPRRGTDRSKPTTTTTTATSSSATTSDIAGNTKTVHKFRSSRIIPYKIKFRTDYVTLNLDNSRLFEGLENPAANPDGFETPVPGILLKTNFKDLFEDYEFEMGARFPTTFDGDEYFLTFKDKKKRLDKTYTAYRRTRRFTPSSNLFPPEKTREVVRRK